MAAAHAQASTDQDKGRVAVAEGDEGLGDGEAAVDVAVLAHQVLPVAADLAAPAAGAISG